jgi:hypothetical protein
MSPPIGATTRAMPGKGRFAVTVVAPSGEVSKSIRCGSVDQVIQVVEREGKRAPRWTMFLVTTETAGKVEPVARWAVGSQGIVRAPYRANESERMDELMHAARNAYAYGRMEPEEIVRYLKSEYGATEQEAFLAATAGRLATPGEYESNAESPEQLADQIRAMDRERTKLSRILEQRGMDAEDEQGRPIHERLLSLQDERNELAGRYRAASRKSAPNPSPKIKWGPRQSNGGYHGDYEVTYGLGDRWGAEYMIDVPHRGTGVRPVFGRRYGGRIVLIGKAPNVAAAKQLAEQDACALAAELDS